MPANTALTIGQAALFGAVQGLTEFLPVSSSGHLELLKALFGLEIPILFDVILHVATFIVIVFVFRLRVWGILRSLWRWMTRSADESDGENLRLAWVVLIASIITGAIGVSIEVLNVEVPIRVTSALFIVTALILIGAKFVHGTKDSIGLREGIIVGLGQGLGVLPGISRSGATISAGLVAGVSREKAGELAFVVFIPAMIGAVILSLKDTAEMATVVSAGPLAVAFITALLVGFVSLYLLMRLITRGRLHWFSLYLIPLGIAGLIFL